MREYEIQITKNNLSKCTKCKKQIETGTKRIIYLTDYFGHPVKKGFCQKCSNKTLREDIKTLEKLLAKLTN